MLKNLFVVALRNAWRNKAFSFIHVLGLSIGISASLVIFLIVRHELSYDRFEADASRIYRVVIDTRFDGEEGHSVGIPAPVPPAMMSEVTGIELTVPIMQFQGNASGKVTIPATTPVVIKEQPGIVFTTGGYPQLLGMEWLAGDRNTALDQPFTAVVSQSRAQQYFPGVAPAAIVGRQIIYNDSLQVTVTGVVKDITEASVFTSKEFISYSTIARTTMQRDFMMEVWNDWMVYSKAWVKLDASNDRSRVEQQMNDMLVRHNPEARRDANNYMALRLQPLSDVHFNGLYADFSQRVAHMPTLYGLVAIAAFLLLLGCINFVNLSTAVASHRAKEIGIRKTVGSSRQGLIFQFMSETLVMCLLAAVLSTSLVPMLLQVFSEFIPSGVAFDPVANPSVAVFLGLLVIVVTVLSGTYPAFVLSKFRPSVVLKNQASTGISTRGAALRKVLTVSQFAVAQFFIVTAVMIGKQIHFALNQDLGYRKEAIVNFAVPRNGIAQSDVLANQIRTFPGVEHVSVGFVAPAMDGPAYSGLQFNNGKEIVQPNIQIRWGDAEYLSVYGIRLVAGRNVRPGDNVNEGLINETGARALGFDNPADAVGRELINGNGSTTPIVGIMKDFHELSFHMPIGPVFFRSSGPRQVFHVSLQPDQGSTWSEVLESMRRAYTALYPASEFRYSFFDDTIAAFYERERNTAKLLNWAMGLSILISCLGLLGLVMYISDARSKEIGIRKILGASLSSLILLLSKEFVLLVLIAFAIATPVAWYAIDQWLQSFVFKTEITWWVFAASGFSLVLVAIVTLGTQTYRTASANPVDSLRTE